MPDIHVNTGPRRWKPPRTQRANPGVNVTILFSQRRKPHLEEKGRVKCKARTKKVMNVRMKPKVLHYVPPRL